MSNDNNNLWSSLATYCSELAPVAGALLGAVGETAAAVDRANTSIAQPRLSTRERVLAPAYQEVDE